MEVAGGYVKQNGSCQGGHGMAGQNYCVVGGCLLAYEDGTDRVFQNVGI